MRAIIIDDEKDAIVALRLLLKEIDVPVQIVGEAQSVDVGLEKIEKHQPDLIFLDVEMPGKSGFDLLDAIKDQPFQTIFTTAYNQFAIKAIKAHAFDYLMKPVDPDELHTTLLRMNSYLQQQEQSSVNMRLSVYTPEGYIFLDANEVIYLQSDGPYTDIQTTTERFTVSKSLKHFEHKLPESVFCRVHNSFILNLNFIKKYVVQDNLIFTKNGDRLPVSRSRKVALKDRLGI